MTPALNHYPPRSLRLNKASGSLHLPTKAPACFASQAAWNQYRADAHYTAGDGWTYCTDCTARRRDQMIVQNRCAFPGTTFVRASGVVVGRRRKETMQ